MILIGGLTMQQPRLGKYEVVFDAGKPWSEWFENDEDLEEALNDFYQDHKEDNYPYDVKIYNANGDDISEAQFIQEMIGHIMEEDYD